jgi:hypothetical protein
VLACIYQAAAGVFQCILSTPELTLLQTSEMWRGKSGEWAAAADERSNIAVFRSVGQIAVRTLRKQASDDTSLDRVVPLKPIIGHDGTLYLIIDRLNSNG